MVDTYNVYNSFGFNAQDGSARADRTQSILSVSALRSTYNASPDITSTGRQQCLFDLLEYIRVPILSVSLDVQTLAELPPAILTKLRGARHISIRHQETTIYPSQWKHLTNILETVNGHFQIQRFELALCPYLENSPALMHFPLHQLTSFKGTFNLLCDIIPFASNLVAVELPDMPDDDDDRYLKLLKYNPMTLVSYLGLPFGYGLERVQNAGKLWPSIEDLSIPGYLSPVDGEVADITSRSTLRQITAFDLHATPRPLNSSLRCIEFPDSSIAYWNSLDGSWEFNIHSPLLSDTPISPEDVTAATKIIKDCWATWYLGLPKPTLRKRTRLAIQGLFGKGKSRKQSSIFADL
ncbi:hypothetical protein M422DRAFT_264737 [Sphaerobolus stellatus SS14]|uniref:Uncharacterized protein n=1 Tax=Sphaerobolus stellatus (strain SS14) TaxID=990650 RepID=A0A0C9UVN9_SPHS4|nr:hypothetical protein M422DRAFT_264737 [Sphaerobolus stellatus SS14]